MKTEAFIPSCTYSKKWKKCIAFHCKFYKIQQKLTAKTFFTKPSSRLLNLLKNRPICFICPKLLNSLKIAPFVQNCSNCSELLKIVQFQNLLCQNVVSCEMIKSTRFLGWHQLWGVFLLKELNQLGQQVVLWSLSSWSYVWTTYNTSCLNW